MVINLHSSLDLPFMQHQSTNPSFTLQVRNVRCLLKIVLIFWYMQVGFSLKIYLILKKRTQ